jgi:hypothetical protein
VPLPVVLGTDVRSSFVVAGLDPWIVPLDPPCPANPRPGLIFLTAAEL